MEHSVGALLEAIESPSRRAILRTLAGAACAPLLAQNQRPNFVILFADDLGYGDLGCYGHPTIRTPNLDRMALEGMRFTQVYSAAPVCTPSRVALMTGRYPVRSGLSRVLGPRAKGGLQDNEITLAQALKPLGYATACVGKWHLGHLERYLPTHHGFDRYFGLPYSNDMGKLARAENPPLPLIRDTKVIEEEPDQSRLTPRYTDEAIRFLRDCSAAGKPFFLYLPYTFPHVPLHASERFRGKSSRGLYGDVVEELDWSVGEIFRTLKELGHDRDTLVIFSSDNGPWLTQHENGGSAGLLRDGKTTTWEGGMREPFLARWPGNVPPGVVTQAFGTLMDIFPTFIKLAGGKIPSDREIDGVDLASVLLHNDPGREPLMFYYSHQDLRAIRKGPWKLHLSTFDSMAHTPVKRLETPALYNLTVDPSEKYDVADSHPDIVKEILEVLEQHKKTIKFGEPQI